MLESFGVVANQETSNFSFSIYMSYFMRFALHLPPRACKLLRRALPPSGDKTLEIRLEFGLVYSAVSTTSRAKGLLRPKNKSTVNTAVFVFF